MGHIGSTQCLLWYLFAKQKAYMPCSIQACGSCVVRKSPHWIAPSSSQIPLDLTQLSVHCAVVYMEVTMIVHSRSQQVSHDAKPALLVSSSSEHPQTSPWTGSLAITQMKVSRTRWSYPSTSLEFLLVSWPTPSLKLLQLTSDGISSHCTVLHAFAPSTLPLDCCLLPQ